MHRLPPVLAPVGFQWTPRKCAETCVQLRDPARRGECDAGGLIENIIDHAEVGGSIARGVNPGGGPDPVLGSLQGHPDDMPVWTAAGRPRPPEVLP